ncbi:MAG: DUF2809 domain-containing protein [Planctomycetota bacterium]
MAQPKPRRRAATGACLLVIVALGLLSRRYPLPGFLAEYTGDALYAVAVFVTLTLVWPAGRIRTLAVAAWLSCAAIECSQLLTWRWLVALRSASVGALVLGQGFQWADLVAHAVGVALAASVTAGLRRWRDSPRTGAVR